MGVAPECRRGLHQFVHLRLRTGIQELFEEVHMVSHGCEQTLIRATASLWTHVNPYGIFALDMSARLPRAQTA